MTQAAKNFILEDVQLSKKCSECKNLFTLETFKAHWETHKINNCPECDYKTVKKPDLELHMQTRHSEERKFVCTQCNWPGLLAPIQPEINLLIHLGILKYSLLNKGATFGQQLLNIHYENITPVKKAAYFLVTSLNYLKTRCELWKPSHRINKIMFGFYILVKMLDFINISVFLRNGAKPLLVERVLGLNQGYASETPPRTFESKYLARELLWNGFIEIIIYMIPLVNYYKLKRIIKQYSPFSKQSVISNVVTKREFTLNTKCAYCGSSPILPHHMGCAHIFCYVCLKGNQTADPKYECPACEHRNQNILCDKVNM